MIEQIEWIKTVEESPDSDITVLMLNPDSETDPVWPGYLDGAEWRYVDGSIASTPTAWAEMPTGKASEEIARLIKLEQLTKALMDEIELDEFGFTAASTIRAIRELI